jgi:hypothetical protein
MTIIESVYDLYNNDIKFKNNLKEVIELEVIKASENKSEFELIWYIFFVRYLKLGLSFTSNIDKSLKDNLLLKSILDSKQKIFTDTDIVLFKKPMDCRGSKLVKQLSVFNRCKE